MSLWLAIKNLKGANAPFVAREVDKNITFGDLILEYAELDSEQINKVNISNSVVGLHMSVLTLSKNCKSKKNAVKVRLLNVSFICMCVKLHEIKFVYTRY